MQIVLLQQLQPRQMCHSFGHRSENYIDIVGVVVVVVVVVVVSPAGLIRSNVTVSDQEIDCGSFENVGQSHNSVAL